MKNDTQTHAANPADNTPEWHVELDPENDAPRVVNGKFAVHCDSEVLAEFESLEFAELFASAPRLKRERDRAQAHFKLAHEELTKLREVNAELVTTLEKASVVTSYDVARTESNYLRSEGTRFEAGAKIQFDEAIALNDEVKAALAKSALLVAHIEKSAKP